uniref:Uncharacterized protein n=1 Tax=Strongyloides papillosus TaxID=174720 RepID=A0A0N5CA04_STREA
MAMVCNNAQIGFKNCRLSIFFGLTCKCMKIIIFNKSTAFYHLGVKFNIMVQYYTFCVLWQSGMNFLNSQIKLFLCFGSGSIKWFFLRMSKLKYNTLYQNSKVLFGCGFNKILLTYSYTGCGT